VSARYRSPVDPEAPNNPHAFAIGMVGSGHRVLEVGCSVGHVTEHLVDRGNTVVGVEIDAEAAAEARAFAERVHVLDLDATPVSSVESDRFDVLVLGDVLEHVRRPADVLADLLTRLEPGGRLVISVPHVGHADVRIMLLQGRWEYQDDGLLDRTHLRWFTRDSLRELLAAAGLQAVRVERVYVGLGQSNVPFDREAVGPGLRTYLEYDPEVYVYQFVVEAVRAGEAGERPDALAGEPAHGWADPAADVDALRHENAALRAELEELRRGPRRGLLGRR
jgi:SAM-dependent methyltransferase